MTKQSPPLAELPGLLDAKLISESEYKHSLNRWIQRCQKQKQHLETLTIPSEDQAHWKRNIKPGLLALLDGLIGAAEEARVYGQTRKTEILDAVDALLVQIARVQARVTQHLQAGSTGLQEMVETAVGPVIQDQLTRTPMTQGTAQNRVGLFDQ